MLIILFHYRPGTGKTITIVEAMQQILSWPDAKILACAPSNSAADLIASRLSTTINPTDLFRFYATSRPKDSLPDELQDYTYTDENGAFSVPSDPSPKAALGAFRVVVTTCQSGSIAHGIGLPRGLFTHIFIDEAGQATEPEALVSIRTMAGPRTNVVLSGDPQQLGPIIRSEIAIGLGLGQSYLERLMSLDVYDLKSHFPKRYAKITCRLLFDLYVLCFLIFLA
jgi:helicase MOV-10